ncbi:MAG: hypothetical protein IT449_16610 [Phycisphaerales bacterium]|nr:hypothetical protein [Phycisphaerales bacterium]
MRQQDFWDQTKELLRVLCLVFGWPLAIAAGVWGAASVRGLFTNDPAPGGPLMHLGALVVLGLAVGLVAARRLFLPSRHLDRMLEKNSIRPLLGATVGLAMGVTVGILLFMALPVAASLRLVLTLCCVVGGVFAGVKLGVRGRGFAGPVTPACPECGYCLWGLTSSRCPECGYRLRGVDPEPKEFRP